MYSVFIANTFYIKILFCKKQKKVKYLFADMLKAKDKWWRKITQLNAEFQRRARREKELHLNHLKHLGVRKILIQEDHKKQGKLLYANMGTIKNRGCKDLLGKKIIKDGIIMQKNCKNISKLMIYTVWGFNHWTRARQSGKWS